MAGKEFKAKERSALKMTRDGLTEENVKSGSAKKASVKDSEKVTLRSDNFSLERNRDAPAAADITSERNKRYRRGKDADASINSEEEDESLQEGSSDGISKHGNHSDVSNRQKNRRTRQYRELSAEPEMGEEIKTTREQGRSFIRKEETKRIRDEGFSEKLTEYESVPESQQIGSLKDEVRRKQKLAAATEGQKKAGRLSFEDEGGSMVKGSGVGFGRKTAGTVVSAGKMAVTAGKEKLREDADENSAVDSVYAGDAVAEGAANKLRETQIRSNRTSGRLTRKGYREGPEDTQGSKLKFSASEGETVSKEAAVKKSAQKSETDTARKKAANRFWQKKRYKDAYKAAASGKVSAGGGVVGPGGVITESLTEKGKRVAKELLVKNKAILLGVGVFALLFMLIAASLSSCSASIGGTGSLVRITSYVSTDEDIHRAEDTYAALEEALNRQINNIESTHPGYDEYRYQVDEIGHNPYHLISYLTAKYNVWTYAMVQDELQDLFEQQYSLNTASSTETNTNTRTVRVGDSLGTVTTSGYCNCSICCGVWAGGNTASGAPPRANHTIAVDAHNPIVPMGTKVIMNGIEYTVEDTGNFARYGVAFDVYYDSHSAASAHGHQSVEAFLADSGGSREIEVTTTETERILTVILNNRGFDAVARANLNAEQLKIYDALNITLGNRDYLFDLRSISAGGGGMSYEIPPEALTDERFANMIHEAEKYLGYPYVWGGASPSTSFDCSGFVSWVINNCGNGWSYGRRTADGLRGVCTYVSPSQAKPGDLIFFERTYNTSGASHVGIYVGNGMMIHCGNPIQYTSIESSYWQSHFMCFGRLP